MRGRFDDMMGAGQAVHEDAAADEEHGCGADHRQRFHHDRCGSEDAAPERLNKGRALPAKIEPGVIEFDDAGNQPVDADRHQNGNGGQHR